MLFEWRIQDVERKARDNACDIQAVRSENSRLENRISELEFKLGTAIMEIDRLQSQIYAINNGN